MAHVLGKLRSLRKRLRYLAGYVDFFHLQDLVDEATSTVRFFTPFDDFTGPPRPATLDAYLSYRQHAAQFLESRNRRIAAAQLPLIGHRPP